MYIYKTPEDISEEDIKDRMTWAQFVGEKEYALQIYRLQNEAGLSFKEARAVLSPHQSIPFLAKEWNITTQAVHNLERRGREKVLKITGDDPEKNEDLMPTRMWTAL